MPGSDDQDRTIAIGGKLVSRLGFGTMRLTGRGIWGNRPTVTSASPRSAAPSTSASSSSTPPTRMAPTSRSPSLERPLTRTRRMS